MSTKISLRDEVLRLASDRNMSLSARGLTLLESMTEISAQQGPTPTVASAELPLSDPSFLAAISDTFTLEEIGLEGSAIETSAILAHSDTVMIGGRRRLRLHRSSRIELLGNRAREPHYQRLLEASNEKDIEDFKEITGDPIRSASAWLRCFLVGDFGSLDEAPVEEIQAAVSALTQLEGLKLPAKTPSLASARHLLELAEFLEPLRLLVGASGGWDGTTALDRFAGRSSELTTLRGHVDVLASQSTLEFLGRGIQRYTSKARRLLSSRAVGVLMLDARGGMGKSTLIAKFILDHARNRATPVPTIYFDFDRATLQPKEPAHLLLEAARQIILQFPRCEPALRPIQDRARDHLLGMRDANWTKLLDRFKTVLREEITHGETATLLVLDTMEVVQADRKALDGVLAFVNAFGDSNFPELRIVAAGRADVPELSKDSQHREKGTRMTLAPLSVTDATEMVKKLGTSLLGEGWNASWNARIAGRSNVDPLRREPLTLRVAVELVRAADPAERDRLSEAIESLGPDADGGFVGPLYQRRILEHVRDPEVRKLAWPGLVFRRITLDIARSAIAPLCNLDVSRIEETFESLAREVWIVSPDGDGLRHRPDLRSRTLPLMRRLGEKESSPLFADVNAAAIRYFASTQSIDMRAKAEWIYHRLLGDEAIESIEQDWDDEIVGHLVGAADDFPPGSPAFEFLQARVARRAMSAIRILSLHPVRALQHISRTMPSLGDMDERKMSPVLFGLMLETIHRETLPANMANVLFALMAKTGRWKGLHGADPSVSPWLDVALVAHDHLSCRNARADSPTTSGLSQLEKRISRQDGPNRLIRRLASHLAWHWLKFRKVDAAVDEQLAHVLSKRGRELSAGYQDPYAEEMDCLRVAAIFGRHTLAPAASLLLSPRWKSTRPSERAYSADEVKPLLASHSGDRLAKSLRAIDKGLASRLLLTDRKPPPVRISNAKCCDAIENAIGSMLADAERDPSSVTAMALRRSLAARDTDWLVPLAYAAARATEGAIPGEALELINEHKQERSTGLFGGNHRAPPRDVLKLLRIADQAGDLMRVTHCFGARAEGAMAAEDLHYLVFCYGVWRNGIRDALR